MRERRREYRHAFREPARIILAAAPLDVDDEMAVSTNDTKPPARQEEPHFSTHAEMVNLSVGGLSCRPPRKTVKQNNIPRYVTVEISLHEHEPPVHYTAEIVHGPESDGTIGLRFDDSPDPNMNAERERRVWRYLIDCQREEIRRKRQSLV